MDSLQAKAALAGLFFGLWPLFINRSGVATNVSSPIFSLIVLIAVSPLFFMDYSSIREAKWGMIITAGILGALGLLFFNSMLGKATPEKVGHLFVVMVVVQVCIPAIYSITINGELNITKIAGFVAALVAAILLLR